MFDKAAIVTLGLAAKVRDVFGAMLAADCAPAGLVVNSSFDLKAKQVQDPLCAFLSWS